VTQQRGGASGPPDPFQTLRDWLDRAERRLNERLSDRSAQEPASRVRGVLSQAALDLQKGIWELWGGWFRSINLPTRTDILRLGKRIAEVEAGIARIDAKLKTLAPEQPPGPREPAATRGAHRPPRTRRPPSAQTPG
jgi:hypothetical protein